MCVHVLDAHLTSNNPCSELQTDDKTDQYAETHARCPEAPVRRGESATNYLLIDHRSLLRNFNRDPCHRHAPLVLLVDRRPSTRLADQNYRVSVTIWSSHHSIPRLDGPFPKSNRSDSSRSTPPRPAPNTTETYSRARRCVVSPCFCGYSIRTEGVEHV